MKVHAQLQIEIPFRTLKSLSCDKEGDFNLALAQPVPVPGRRLRPTPMAKKKRNPHSPSSSVPKSPEKPPKAPLRASSSSASPASASSKPETSSLPAARNSQSSDLRLPSKTASPAPMVSSPSAVAPVASAAVVSLPPVVIKTVEQGSSSRLSARSPTATTVGLGSPAAQVILPHPLVDPKTNTLAPTVVEVLPQTQAPNFSWSELVQGSKRKMTKKGAPFLLDSGEICVAIPNTVIKRNLHRWDEFVIA